VTARIAAPTTRAQAPAAAPARDPRTLARDVLALLLIGLLLIVHHMQHPLLLHETQFGRAWRNESLQIVVALALLGVTALLVRGAARERGPRDARTGAATAVLGLYAAFTALVVLVRWHPLGAALGLDQALFTERPTDEMPLARLDTLYSLTVPFVLVAIAAVVSLWEPWTRLSLYVRAVRANLAPLAVAVLVLVAWEVLIVVFRIQEFLLPRPSVIAGAFMEQYPRLVSAGWNTFQNAFWGYAVGCGLGILTGFAAARFTAFSQALLPVAVAINAIPIIALAPIFNNWFGALNPASKIAIVAVLAYFPTMVSTVKGLTSADPLSLELMHSYAAGKWAIFRKLRLPTALPFMFSALKVATTLSMIGAIVSEYFGGSTAGLGYRIRDDAGLFKYPEAWAAIFVASLFGIAFYLVVTALERTLMHWHVSFREAT
jgi:NitT/TauT family transport system permease protein